MKTEVFMIIKGYEGLYQISNKGNVKNSKGLVMKPRFDKDGYKRISLTKHVDGSKIRETFYIHKLVLNEFLTNPEKLECANHKDENKENNHVKNLEWCSRKYNNGYGNRNIKGKKHLYRKVIDLTTNTIYPNMKKAGEVGGVTSGAIFNCCNGRNKTSYGHSFMYHDEYMTKQGST